MHITMHAVESSSSGPNKNELLQTLFEEWVSSNDCWTSSQLVAQAKTSVRGTKTGARRWMMRSEIIEKYQSEQIADELIAAKLNDPVQAKTCVKNHEDLPHREDLRLYLVWDSTYETDVTDTVIEQLFSATSSGTHKKDKKDKKRKRSSSSSSSSSTSSDESDSSDDSSDSSSTSDKKKKKKKKGGKKGKHGKKTKKNKNKKNKKEDKEKKRVAAEQAAEKKRLKQEAAEKKKEEQKQCREKVTEGKKVGAFMLRSPMCNGH